VLPRYAGQNCQEQLCATGDFESRTKGIQRPALSADLVHNMHSGARIQSNLHELGCLVCRRTMVNAVPMRLRGSSIHRGAARGSRVVYNMCMGYHSIRSSEQACVPPTTTPPCHHLISKQKHLLLPPEFGDAIMTTMCERGQNKVVLKLSRLQTVTLGWGTSISCGITIPSSQGMRKHKYLSIFDE
jgi:hypothetical protein